MEQVRIRILDFWQG